MWGPNEFNADCRLGSLCGVSQHKEAKSTRFSRSALTAPHPTLGKQTWKGVCRGGTEGDKG